MTERSSISVLTLGLLLVLVFLSHISPDLTIAVFCSLMASLASIYASFRISKNIGNYIFIFLVFHALYGMSGPIGYLIGQEYSSVFSGVSMFPHSFLRQHVLSLLGFMVPVLLLSVTYPVSRIVRYSPVDKTDKLFRSSYGVAFISSAMFAFDLIRVGGVVSLFGGKASFQSTIGDLSASMPYQIVADVSVAVFAYASSLSGRVHGRRLLCLSIMLFPVIVSYLLLGQRGPLIGWLIISLVAYSLYRTYRIKFGHILILASVYIVMSMTFSVRGTLPAVFESGDIGLIWEVGLAKDNLVRSLSPSTNEFGAAFGNYSAFVEHKLVDYPQYGRTYVEGLAVMVPGFAYPGTKPYPITYEFRDMYFPGLQDRGRIAGTGFSSILEAYINFGRLGSFVVYFSVGLILVFAEVCRYRYRLIGIINYVVMAQLLQTFHRSSMGMVLGSVFWIFVITACISFVINKVSPRIGRVR